MKKDKFIFGLMIFWMVWCLYNQYKYYETQVALVELKLKYINSLTISNEAIEKGLEIIHKLNNKP